jgi:triosephosphate isomerase (TIM)
MKLPFIAGNWKMHKDVAATVRYVKELRLLVKDVTDVEIVVAPPFTSLHPAAEAARNSNVAVAGQDLYWEAEGAFTGEVSAAMIREAGAEYVIVGHSERRTLFGETDGRVRQKVAAAFAAGLTPIACIGETLAERDAGATFAVLDRQLAEGLQGLSAGQVAQLVLAYEPVWAIGTGRTATPGQAAEVHAHIRAWLRGAYGEAAGRCHIIYGGSVKPDNIGVLIGETDVDGALVGGASLEVEPFVQIVSQCRGRAV